MSDQLSRPTQSYVLRIWLEISQNELYPRCHLTPISLKTDASPSIGFESLDSLLAFFEEEIARMRATVDAKNDS